MRPLHHPGCRFACSLLPFAVLMLGAAPLRAQNCSRTSVGFTAISDLGAATYQGFQGGLYPGGQNTMPAAHAAAGLAAGSAIEPLDALGRRSPAGKVVLLSIGMSNTSAEFTRWIPVSNADPQRDPAVVVVDGAQGGQSASIIAIPTAPFWDIIDERLELAGVTPQQVQVAWLKEAVARPSTPFPAGAIEFQQLQVAICQIAKRRYPNLRICYVSSRIYAGYAVTTLSPEPYAYESGFAVKWLIEQQIRGDPALNFDPSRGPVLAPWLAWGPYMWADGEQARNDGLRWVCDDYLPDGTHPSPQGCIKVARMLDYHFLSDPTARPWYVRGAPAPGVLPYGQGCPGQRGQLLIATNSLPFVGNPAFAYGIRNAAPLSGAAMLWSRRPAQLPFAGCTLFVDPSQLIFVMPFVTDPSGSTRARMPIPLAPTAIGASVFTQWLALDPEAKGLRLLGGAAMTHGVELRFGE